MYIACWLCVRIVILSRLSISGVKSSLHLKRLSCFASKRQTLEEEAVSLRIQLNYYIFESTTLSGKILEIK